MREMTTAQQRSVRGTSNRSQTDSQTTPPSRRWRVRRAAVLGAGTMGAQIAAHFANQGIPCDLLDLPASLDDAVEANQPAPAQKAKQRLAEIRPSPLYRLSSLELIRPGTFARDLERVAQADWIVEAVTERLDVKQRLWAHASEFVGSNAIVSTNTSGIPIASICEALPVAIRPRFLGTHFFNPPRYLQLLELIPTSHTDPEVTGSVARFARETLGKSVVVARDVPNFVANRLGSYGFVKILEAMEEMGLGPDEVDSVTGVAMARPRSATFRTLDLVGLDVFVHVCDTARRLGTGEEREAFRLPPYLNEMVDRGWLGEKAGQGFYKRTRQGGETQILALDPARLEYRPRRRMREPSVLSAREQAEPSERLRTLLAGRDRAAEFAWRVLAPFLAYAARQVGFAAEDVDGVDRAMRGGFGWELGPFEAWDALGVRQITERLTSDGFDVPLWVNQLAARDGAFYRYDGAGISQFTPQGEYETIPDREIALPFAWVRDTRPVVSNNAGATLFDLGDGVAWLDFHAPKQAIGPDLIDMVHEAADHAASDFLGLVVGSHVRPNFCVGANLFLILMAAQDEEWEELDALIRRLQQGFLALKHLPVPVVSAPYGMTLGGGVELAMAADRTVAASETYMGFVEVGAGVVPAGGGCAEMVVRALADSSSGHATSAPGTGGIFGIVPGTDRNADLIHAFETIGLAKVSACALEARDLGLLRPTDVITPNLEHLLETAKRTVLDMHRAGYAPPSARKVPVLGKDARALLDLIAQHLVWGHFASDHDFKIARKLAYVLTGGDRPPGQAAEEYFLDLEREAFLSLCGEEKTLERMEHVLKTGKPLRN